MTINNLPKEERPREKLFSKGRESLSNAELIAILLHTGTREKSALSLADDVLAADSRGILFLGECLPEELLQIKGLGEAKVCQLLAAVELGKRAAVLPRKDKVEIDSPGKIADLFMEEMRYYKKEYFKVLLINVKGGIIEQDSVAIGDLCSTVIHPREVFTRAVRRSAAAVVLVHNHPSGNPAPSKDDVLTTERLVEAGRVLGINVLDHIIIGDGTYISFKNEGLL